MHRPLSSLTNEIIGAAIEVHRILGPGLLESTYEACLAYELQTRGLHTERQKLLSISYKSLVLEDAYRLDLVVNRSVIVEIKSVKSLDPVHEAQLLSYLRLSGSKVGLLINFNVPLLKTGLRRLVL